VLRRLQPLATLARNPALRRCGIGFALFSAAEYGEWIAVLVYAFGHGGASASGLVAFAQLTPCVVLSPLLATFADRYQPGRVLVWGYVAQGVGMGLLAAALLAHAAPIIVYAAAIATAPTYNITRPTMNVLLPVAVHTPDELTAGNAAMGWIESVGVVLGPLTASLGLAISTAGVVLALFSIMMLGSAWIASPLTRSLPAVELEEGPSSVLGEAFDGFKLLSKEPRTAVLVGVLNSQAFFFGAMDVLFVVLAYDVLGLGGSGVGVMNASFGAGGLIAVLVTLGLVGHRRLAPSLIVASLLTAAIALIAAWPEALFAVLMLAAANVGRSMFDVAGRTLLQRTGSPAVLGRVFGVLESLDMLGLALGSLLVPLLVSLGGATAAVVGVGLIMPLITLVLLPAILGADARATVPIVQIGLLRSTSVFRLLPAPRLEAVARLMQPLAAVAGEVVIREGDPGDLYYLIAKGEVRVSTAHGLTTELGRGEGFGEIALLHDRPRTATVTARVETNLYTLEREDFLEAVTGMPSVHHAVRAQAADRLGEQADLPQSVNPSG
jgi:MFS family permease